MKKQTLSRTIGTALLSGIVLAACGQGKGPTTVAPQVITPLPSVYGTAPANSGIDSSPSGTLLRQFKARQKLQDRKQAIEQSALLQRLTDEFQKDTVARQALTTADLQRLHQIARLAKSIQSKLED